MAVVLTMAYTEALFCALAAWALVFVLERRWVAAGVCCALAGLVRPTAPALVLAVGLAALVCLLRRRDGRRPPAAALLAPLGLLGYLLWVGGRTHPGAGLADRLGAWSEPESRGWQTGFDRGAATAGFVTSTLTGSTLAMSLGTARVILASLVMLGVTIWRRWNGRSWSTPQECS
jgi:hypothetical protein